MMAEIDRVMADLHMSEKVASKKVIQMSAKSDSYGYDRFFRNLVERRSLYC